MNVPEKQFVGAIIILPVILAVGAWIVKIQERQRSLIRQYGGEGKWALIEDGSRAGPFVYWNDRRVPSEFRSAFRHLERLHVFAVVCMLAIPAFICWVLSNF